jgi:hypothetical protein
MACRILHLSDLHFGRNDKPESIEALARLVADRDLRRSLGAAGRARAEQVFDLEPFRRAHLELYSRELARRRLPAPAPIP